MIASVDGLEQFLNNNALRLDIDQSAKRQMKRDADSFKGHGDFETMTHEEKNQYYAGSANAILMNTDDSTFHHEL